MKYKYKVAIIYAVVLFLDRLDLTIVNITLPTIAKDFSIPVTQTEWVNTSYLLALVTSILISHFLGSRFGFKRIFNIAISTFGIASLGCAYADDLLVLCIFRLFQGVGGGLIVPVGMSLVYQAFDKSEYASITSYMFMPTLIAPALAPFLGGIITANYGWQWVFLFVVPICILASIATYYIIKEPAKNRDAKCKWGSFMGAVCALIAVFFAISLLGRKDYNYITCIAILVAACAVYFVVVNQKNSAQPTIYLEYFKIKIFRQANILQACFQLCQYGAIFLVSTYLQVFANMPVKLAGLVMGMQALGSICINRITVMLFWRFGPKLPLIIGLAGIGIVTPCVMFVRNENMLLMAMLILFLRGNCTGLCSTPIQTMSLLSFNDEQISRAGSIIIIVRQLAIAMGIVISSVLINIGSKYSVTPETNLFDTIDIFVFIPAFVFIPLVCSFAIFITLRINSDKVRKHQSLGKT